LRNIHELILRAERASHLLNELAMVPVCDEDTLGELEAEDFDARREVRHWFEAVHGISIDRFIEVAR